MKWARIGWIVAISFVPSVWARSSLTTAGDSSRIWKVQLLLENAYDDNIFTSSKDPVEDFATTIQPTFQLRLPLGQTFVGAQYQYGNVLYWQRSDHRNESHSMDLSLTQTFSSRLSLSIIERFRFGLEPELVNVVEGVPVVTRQRGDYLFNYLSSSLSYYLSRQWLVSVGSTWEQWNYAEAAYEANNRNTYSISAALYHQLTLRTTLGVNYQYSRLMYEHTGLEDNRNNSLHTFYSGMTHQMNPQLSLRLAMGYQVGEFDDGLQSGTPYAQGSLSYNYAVNSTISSGFSYFLSSSEVLIYRSAEVAAGFLQADHRLTQKMRVNGRISYSLSTYQHPTPPITTDVTENAFEAGLGLEHAFTPMIRGSLRYHHREVQSDRVDRAYRRNLIYIGLGFTY